MTSGNLPSTANAYSEIDRDFLLAVFHEANDHMRNTEQKYLIVTAAYLGLLSLITSSIASPVDATLSSMASHFLLLLIGTVVYTMQGWYRTWKQHYLDVCLDIRQQLAGPADESLFPYWLRSAAKIRRRTIDNLLKALTLLVNLGLVCLVASELWYKLLGSLGTLVAVLFIIAYGFFLFSLDRMMRISSYLSA